MASTDRTYDDVKKNPALISVTTEREKIALYDGWTAYEQDMKILDYKGPCYAACSINRHFSGDRKAAFVLDVACGTGEVAKEMKNIGFNHFVGIDGSKSMMEEAQKTGLYQDLKLCVLGEQDLPVEKGKFDLAVIIGALSVDMVGVSVLRKMCKACKTGGFIAMTTRHGPDDLAFTAELQREQKQMESEGIWRCVNVTRVENWIKSITAEPGYIPGSVYIYEKL